MILGIDINFLIKLILGIVILYSLTLLAVGVFKGWESAKTILHYTRKFWWVIVAVIAFIIVSKSLKSKKDGIDSKIEKLKNIDGRTIEDEKELKRLEAEKKRIEDEIQKTTDKYEHELEELKKKPSNPDEIKPGDAGRSSDLMNDAWRKK